MGISIPCIFPFIFLVIQFATAQQCDNPVPSCDPTVDYFPAKVQLQLLKTAVVEYKNTYVDITVTDSAGVSYFHRLLKCGCPVPPSTPAWIQVISIPPARLFVDDSPSLAFVTRSLSQGDRIVAVGSPSRVFSSAIRSRITEDTTRSDLSTRDNIDVSLISSFGVSGYNAANITIPYFVNGGPGEPSPLAQAEWMKIFALMFDKVHIGNLRFDDIVTKYNNIKVLANRARRRPSVLLNYPFTFSGSTSWFIPSEKQSVTQYLRDANVDYFFMNDGKNTTNFETLKGITTKFKWARYILLSGQFPPRTNTSLASFFLDESLNAVNNAIAVNNALRSLAAVKCGNVWSRTKRISELGANDYFEQGSIRPDLILQDIVNAVHPEAGMSGETTFSFKHQGTAAELADCPYNELLGPAPPGLIYVDTEISVSNLNRFQVEDKLVTDIIPEVSTDMRIPAGNIEAFFEKPQLPMSTVLLLRTMVQDKDSDGVLKDADKIAEAVRKALGAAAEIKVLSAKKSSSQF